MMMDPHQLELGGTKETAHGLEPGQRMSLMIPSSTTAAITETMKNILALILMMAQ